MADLTQKQIEQAVDAANMKERNRRSEDAIKGILLIVGIPLVLLLLFALGN